MNPHPIFVHFPIALLTVYSLMELIRWQRLNNLPYWFYIKGILVMLGGLSALVAYFSGDIAKEAVRNHMFTSPIKNFVQVVDMHEFFASLTIIIFGIIATCYLASWLDKSGMTAVANKYDFIGAWKFITKLINFVLNTPLIIILAIAGLIVITITGGLGGIIVYGTEADPIFKAIYNILFN